jgi:hypothetical protein
MGSYREFCICIAVTETFGINDLIPIDYGHRKTSRMPVFEHTGEGSIQPGERVCGRAVMSALGGKEWTDQQGKAKEG